jgi:hypothetical protein
MSEGEGDGETGAGCGGREGRRRWWWWWWWRRRRRRKRRSRRRKNYSESDTSRHVAAPLHKTSQSSSMNCSTTSSDQLLRNNYNGFQVPYSTDVLANAVA